MNVDQILNTEKISCDKCGRSADMRIATMKSLKNYYIYNINKPAGDTSDDDNDGIICKTCLQKVIDEKKNDQHYGKEKFKNDK